MPFLLKDPIRIVPYDPQWPDLYDSEKCCLEMAPGSRLASIEHFGSTAIPDLEAKPIIDMIAAVDDLEDVSEYVATLEQLGYVDVQINPGLKRRLFCKGGYNEGTHHLHFVACGSDQWLLPLRFRDFLRTHESVRRQYGALKQQLARQHQHDLDAYSEDKGAFVRAVLEVVDAQSR